MTVTIDKELVIKTWNQMSREYRTVISRKQDAKEMEFVDQIFARIGVMDRGKFMNDYCTTVGNTIYLNFEIGSDQRSYVSQLETCAHEHQHKIQYDKEGVSFLVRYIADPSYRMQCELDGYRAGYEVRYALTGKGFDVNQATSRLMAYRIGDLNEGTARRSFELIHSMLMNGATFCESSKRLLEIVG